MDHIYQKAAALNNVGIKLIERGWYEQASRTLRDATEVIRTIFHLPVDNDGGTTADCSRFNVHDRGVAAQAMTAEAQALQQQQVRCSDTMSQPPDQQAEKREAAASSSSTKWTFITLCVGEMDFVDFDCLPQGCVLLSLVCDSARITNHQQPNLEAAAILYNLAIADIVLARAIAAARPSRARSLRRAARHLLQLSFHVLDGLLRDSDLGDDLMSLREIVTVAVVVLPTLLGVAQRRPHELPLPDRPPFSTAKPDGLHLTVADIESQLEYLHAALEEIDQALQYFFISHGAAPAA